MSITLNKVVKTQYSKLIVPNHFTVFTISCALEGVYFSVCTAEASITECYWVSPPVPHSGRSHVEPEIGHGKSICTTGTSKHYKSGSGNCFLPSFLQFRLSKVEKIFVTGTKCKVLL